MTLKEHIKKVQEKKIDIVVETKRLLKLCSTFQESHAPFSKITTDLALSCADFVANHPHKETLPLAGVFVTVKDAIVIKDEESTASSDILKGYIPVFNATVIKKIKDAGGIILGKTTQDEFGFGSFCTNVGKNYVIPKNPFNVNHVAGGSSGGSAVITALFKKEQIPHISIAESTGGSIECPASFCGVIGFCPTYGKVSRNGLISYANSFDKIGLMSSDIDDILLGLNCISGKDSGDSTSVDSKQVSLEKYVTKKITIGVLKEAVSSIKNTDIKKQFEQAVSLLKKKGHTIKDVSLETTFLYGIPTYYILAMSEASTNLSALCGLRYGVQDVRSDEHFTDYFKRIRSTYFGDEAKRRIMLGTFTRMAGYRDAYYIKAAKIRTKIIEEYKAVLSECDVIISPSMPFTAPSFSNVTSLKPIEHYLADSMTVGPNLAGMPHASFPIGFDTSSMPIGLLATSNHFCEDVLLYFGKELLSEVGDI